MTKRYECRIVGQLWMGGTAATSVSVTAPMEYPQAENETDAEYECRMVECAANTGDFQSVDGMEIIRITDARANAVHYSTTFEIIQPFSEEVEMAWFDRMEPVDF